MTSFELEDVARLLSPFLTNDNRNNLVTSLQSLCGKTDSLSLFTYTSTLCKTLLSIVCGRDGLFSEMENTVVSASMDTIEYNVCLTHDDMNLLFAHENVNTLSWDIHELTFTVSHTMPNVASNLSLTHMKSDDFRTLKQFVQSVGGSLSVATVTVQSLLLYQLTLPLYTCLKIDGSPSLESSVSCPSLDSQNVVKTRTDSFSYVATARSSSGSGRRNQVVPTPFEATSKAESCIYHDSCNKQRSYGQSAINLLSMMTRYTSRLLLITPSSSRVSSIHPSMTHSFSQHSQPTSPYM